MKISQHIQQWNKKTQGKTYQLVSTRLKSSEKWEGNYV